MESLESVGDFDEEFIMYFEDIEYSIRCRVEGWKIFYTPESVVYHKHRGTASSELCEYLCSRSRLLCLAKHFPLRFPQSIKTSHFYLKNEHENLYHSLIQSIEKLVEHNDTETSIKTLGELKDVIVDVFGYVRAFNFFSHIEVMLGLRKIKIGIYDHAFHFAGGGQRYVAKLAEILQDRYDITYIASKDITLDKYKEWFDIDLSGCRLEIIKIPFYEQRGRDFIDEGMVISEEKNPFDIISEESLYYIIFINANMLGKVKPLSTLSVFICHFPDRDKKRFFHVDKYTHLISNSAYTSFWIKKRWGLNPAHCIHPPVDMYNNKDRLNKKKIIHSVARFEIGGSKKQLEMINAFFDLTRKYPDIKNEWRFILAGGSFQGNPYFAKVKEKVDSAHCNIELRSDLNHIELKELYSEASIFWHACGLNETTPHLIEHFGMTTVEAMQNYCVPIVFDGGGQREIVEHGISGFSFKTIKELQLYTVKVINDERLRKEIAAKAHQRSHDFNLVVFKKNVLELFSGIENELRGMDAL
ncbi:MAG: glycosyltransferase [Candidatus Mariimomonas ferrooxydans]